VALEQAPKLRAVHAQRARGGGHIPLVLAQGVLQPLPLSGFGRLAA
jgi:hypothetical protein